MMGVEQKADRARPVVASTETISGIAAAGQRQQLAALIDALTAHPDMAAHIYALLRRSP